MESQPSIDTSAQARKFLFDLAFDNGMNTRAAEKEKPKPAFTQEQLDEEKKLSYEEGFSAGQRAMMEDQQQYMNTLLSQIDRKVAHVLESSKAIWENQMKQSQEIALVIARKIMPTFAAAHGLDEISSIVSKVMTEMSREPRLVFRINENQFDNAKARIESIAAQSAYAGKLVILGDPELGAADCRIEWADGGIERDVRTLWADIDRVMGEVQSFAPLDAQQTTPALPQTSSDSGIPTETQQQPDVHATGDQQ